MVYMLSSGAGYVSEGRDAVWMQGTDTIHLHNGLEESWPPPSGLNIGDKMIQDSSLMLIRRVDGCGYKHD